MFTVEGAWPSAPSCSPYGTGATPLHYACARADADCVHILLRGGADPNATTTSGEVPLHYLCRAPLPVAKDESDDEAEDKEPPDANLTHIAKLLIDFGAHPDGFEDRSLNRADPPPPPVVEDDGGKKKKGKKGKKAPAKKGKGKKGDKKGGDEAEPPPPPEPMGALQHSGHRASSETHAALLTPLQHAASVGHHAIVKELSEGSARGGRRRDRCWG